MSQETILIIEDEKALVEILEYNLVREGYRVFTATDGG
ncbi:MAG TPA: DNA-binding response regulator, partial [Planctomycetaceae bacterium]|nr:DNA-binding response regulator [Planctomycetaceae bacterium]